MNPDYLDFLTALTEAGAEFVVVGAQALAAHGLRRDIPDALGWLGISALGLPSAGCTQGLPQDTTGCYAEHLPIDDNEQSEVGFSGDEVFAAYGHRGGQIVWDTASPTHELEVSPTRISTTMEVVDNCSGVLGSPFALYVTVEGTCSLDGDAACTVEEGSFILDARSLSDIRENSTLTGVGPALAASLLVGIDESEVTDGHIFIQGDVDGLVRAFADVQTVDAYHPFDGTWEAEPL